MDVKLNTHTPIRSCVNFILQSPNKEELTNEWLQYEETDADVDERTAELCDQENTDETTQCEKCKERNAKTSIVARESQVKRSLETSDDLLQWFAMANWTDKRHLSHEGEEYQDAEVAQRNGKAMRNTVSA